MIHPAAPCPTSFKALRHVLAASLLVGACASAAAQTPVLLYQNDFETVNTSNASLPGGISADNACTAWGGTAQDENFAANYNGTGSGTLASSVVFQQVGTADRVCWNRTGASTNLVDSSTTGGKYSGGFARNRTTVESWSIELVPDGQRYINGRMDLTHVIPGNLGQPNPPNGDHYNGQGTASFTLQGFRVAAGATYTFEYPNVRTGATGFINVNGFDAANGVNAKPNRIVVGSTAATPVFNEIVDVGPNSQNPIQPRVAHWQPHSFSIDTSSFGPTDRLVLVATPRNGQSAASANPADPSNVAKYIVFDNLEFTAAAAPITIPPAISKSFSAASVVAGGTASLTISISNPSGLETTALTVTDALPTPLQLVADSVSTTCTAPTGSTLTDTGNTISMAGYTLPIDGCTITAQVQWPTTATAQCLAAAPGNTATNTITPDLDQFTTAAGADPSIASAALACQMADLALTLPTAPSTATRGGTLTYSLNLQNLSQNLPAAASTVQLTLPAGTSLATGSDARCNAAGLCTFGTLAADASESFTIVLNVPADYDATSVPLSATAQTSTPETEPVANNSVNTTATLQNTPPVANDDSGSTVRDTPLAFTTAQLLGNDTDPDGGTLSVTSVQAAVNGTVTLNGNDIVFTPADGFVGGASFTYTISDGQGGTATATVTITVSATPVVLATPVPVGGAGLLSLMAALLVAAAALQGRLRRKR